jgi:hypothetical protein
MKKARAAALAISRSFGRPGLCLLLLFFPARVTSQKTPQLSSTDRIRLAEAFRLGDKLGDRLWAGWSKVPFAVLLVTDDYEFLIRHPKPSSDFSFAGQDPLLNSAIYFRKRKFSPNLLATFPAVGGISTIVVGQTEKTASKTSTRWVVTLLHEHFHQLQDSQPNFYTEVAALGLSRGDQTGSWMLNFPFPYDRPDVSRQFSVLSQSLAEALAADEPGKFHERLSAYQKETRNFRELLSADDYKYFSFQLWKEGIARYTEYRIAALAAVRYQPSRNFLTLKDFTSFASDARVTLDQIISELREPSLNSRQRVSFYAFGAGEGLLSDRLIPTGRSNI